MAVVPDQVPVAVVGFACRLPGGCNTPAQFWDFLCQDRIASCKPPSSRFSLQGHYDGSGRPRTMVSPGGMFIDIDPADIDARFFGLSQSEAIAMDPQQRQLLEVIYEGLENAGIPLHDISGRNFGCFAGQSANDYSDIQARDPNDRVSDATTGLGRAMLSNRISHFLDLKGTSMTIDTACSSSLVSVDVACRYLQSGDLEGAIVAGCNLYLNPEHNTDNLAMKGAATKTGRCNTFDTSADGYIRSEAVNMVILKRLDDAIVSGDPIRAVIRGTASNSDGWTPGIASPSSSSQATVIRKAYQRAGIQDFEQTAFVEAHGTGTQAGDPTEALGISSVFTANRSEEDPLLIGSVKSNIGHSEPAAGLSGLIKAILGLEHSKFPGNPTFVTPSPRIDFQRLKLRVVDRLTAWPSQKPKRVSVNSFGYGGTNSHAVLESPDCFLSAYTITHITSLVHSSNLNFGTYLKTSMDTQTRLLPCSANTEESLQASVDALRKHFINPAVKVNMNDVAFTLSQKRTHHFYRAFALVKSKRLAKVSFSRGFKNPETPLVCFVFTGQGSQWPFMGRDIIQRFSCASQLLDKLDRSLAETSRPPKWSLRYLLCDCPDANLMKSPGYSQPAVTALQLCQVEILRAWGVSPSAVVGHSSGEIAAASAAGFLDSCAAIKIAYLRGIAVEDEEPTAATAMLAVGSSADDIAEELSLYEGRIQIACFNSNQNLTLSGTASELEAMMSHLHGKGKFARMLQVNRAYHSRWMNPVADRYRELLDEATIPVAATQPQCPFYSSVNGSLLTANCDVQYWIDNLTQAVRFDKAFSAMTDDLGDIVLEIGPTGTLKTPIQQLKGSKSFQYLSAAKRNAECSDALLEVAGHIFLRGGEISLTAVNQQTDGLQGKTIVDLPNYAWDHSRKYWSESQASREWRFRQFLSHDLLGSKILGTPWTTPVFHQTLRIQDLPWLNDHRISGNIVFPAAGYLSMVLEAIQQIVSATGGLPSSGDEEMTYEVSNILFKKAMVFAVDATHNQVDLSMTPMSKSSSSWFSFRFQSLQATQWETHCTGEVRAMNRRCNSVSTTDQSVRPLRYPVPSTLWYKAMNESGLNFGPSFRKLLEVECFDGSEQSRCRVDLTPPESPKQQSNYLLHPACLDACLQSAAPSLFLGRRTHLSNTVVPAFIGSLTVRPRAAHAKEGIASATRAYSGRGSSDNPTSFQSRITLATMPDGLTLLEIDALKLTDLDKASGDRPITSFAQEIWRPDLFFVEQAKSVLSLQEAVSLVLHRKPTATVVEICLGGHEESSVWLDTISQDQTHRHRGRLHYLCDDANRKDVFRSRYSEIVSYTFRLYDRENWNAETVWPEEPVDAILFHRTSADSAEDADLHSQVMARLAKDGVLIKCFHNGPVSRVEKSDSVSQNLGPKDSRTPLFSGDEPHTPNHPNVGCTTSPTKRRRRCHLRADKLDYNEGPPSACTIIVPTLSDASRSNCRPRLTILGSETPSSLATAFKERLSLLGWSIQYTSDFRKLDSDDLVIADGSALGLSSQVGNDLWQALKLVLVSGSRLLWLQFSDGPEIAVIIGLCRTVRNEYPMSRIKIVGLEARAMISAEQLSFVDKMLCKFDDVQDAEFMEHQGQIGVGRVAPLNAFRDPDDGKESEKSLHGPQKCVRLKCDQVGISDSLRYYETSLSTSGTDALPEGFVEIEIMAAGLNFKDVATILGTLTEDLTLLGLESAGYIRRVAPDVEQFRPGDRVVTLRKGSFANRLWAPTHRVQKIPDTVTFEQAASLPCVFGTALYSLVDLANIKAGDIVLINSAAGGVGIAAMQICQHVGATILATVSSKEKREFIGREYGVPDDHIFDSRKPGLYNSVMSATNDHGCDIILNSLTGELLHESWLSIADNGVFVEIGKKDILDCERLSMAPFGRNASFRAVDMSHESMPEKTMARLLEQILQMIRLAQIKPIEPLAVFGFNDIPGAVRYMRAGQHIGKVVISDLGSPSKVEIRPSPIRVHFDPELAYLLVGGLKGLCGSLAIWMARNGARKIVLLSRSGYEDSTSQSVLANMSGLGCETFLVIGDVSNLDDVRRAFKAACSPIDGVIHGAMVLRDKTFEAMTADDFRQTTASKVTGTRNLHTTSQEQRHTLSFFTLLSSISGIIGQPAQANYAAANAYQDAFAAFRRRQGLKACSVDLGIVEDVGYMAAHSDITARLNRVTWATRINEARLHQILEKAITLQQAAQVDTNTDPRFCDHQLITGISYPQPKGSKLVTNPRFSMLQADPGVEAALGVIGEAGFGNDPFAGKIQEVMLLKLSYRNSRKDSDIKSINECIISLLSNRLAEIMALPDAVEPGKPLASYGLDSLAAVELRNWIRLRLQVDVLALELTSAKNMAALGALVGKKLIGTDQLTEQASERS